VERLHRQIVTDIKRRATQPDSDRKAAREHHALMSKQPGSRTYGLRAPAIHAMVKDLRPAFRQLSHDDRRALALMLFRSRYEEEAAVGVELAAMSVEAIPLSDFHWLDRAMDLCVSWPMCDGFSLCVLQPLMSRHPKEISTLLRRWNHDDNLWKRRASVVTFTRKAGESGRYTELVLELCEGLLFDREDLVLKGVGWALKDNLRGDYERVLTYIKSCRARGVSSVVTRYAIRDLQGRERTSVLAVKGR